MLRHSRAHTYWVNRKNKEKDKIHGGSKPYYEQSEEDYLTKKNKFNLRQYLKEAWNIQI